MISLNFFQIFHKILTFYINLYGHHDNEKQIQYKRIFLSGNQHFHKRNFYFNLMWNIIKQFKFVYHFANDFYVTQLCIAHSNIKILSILISSK